MSAFSGDSMYPLPNIRQIMDFQASATPPALSNTARLYGKLVGSTVKLYTLTSAGVEIEIGSGSGGSSPLTTKGDLYTYDTADQRLPVGNNGDVLTPDSSQSTGLKWRKNKIDATAAPTSTDDANAGYSIGSRWVDVTNDKEYVCVDATAGVAVWKETTATGGGGGSSPLTTKGDLYTYDTADQRLGVGTDNATLTPDSSQPTGLKWRKNNLTSTTPPNPVDDSSAGYSIGSRWIDVAADKEYVCVDDSVGAAVWEASTGGPLTTKGDLYTYDTKGQRLPVGGNGDTLTPDSSTATGLKWRKNNLTSTTPPNPVDDSSVGYAVGSRWIDVAADKEYVCVDDSIGAAVWQPSTGGPLTTKGDIYTYDTSSQRLPVGGNGDTLTPDSSEATGLKWRKNNLTATTPPNPVDGSNVGYSVGSRWIDVSADKEYVCVDDTANAAVWAASTGGPLTTKGDLYTYDTTSQRLPVGGNGDTLTPDSSEATGLKWRKNNLSSTTPPNPVDGSNVGYSVGSRWIDVSADKEYVCVDDTANAAIWKPTSGGPLTTKGDLYIYGTQETRLPIGGNGDTLTPDSSDSNGIKWRKNNLSSTTPPNPVDGSNVGYAVGSRWIDVAADKEYVCVDDTANAAIWVETTKQPSLDITGLTATDPALDDEVPEYDKSVSANRKTTWAKVGGIFAHVAEGRLTLQSGVPVPDTDQTGKAQIYYTPYVGDRIALYDGTRWTIHKFTEVSGQVPATNNANFDIFIWNNSGTLTLEMVNWANDTTRGTALTRQNGVWVKSGDPTRRYLGTGRTTSNTGQTEDSGTNVSGGASARPARRLLWNAYNRVPRRIHIFENTANWTTTNTAFHAYNNNNNNRLEMLSPDPDNRTFVNLQFLCGLYAGGTVTTPQIGFGLDSTSADATTTGDRQDTSDNATRGYSVEYSEYIPLGYHYIQLLEKAGVNTTTVWGGSGGQAICGATGWIEA